MGNNAKREVENQSGKPEKSNKKKRKEVFPYGNYKNYYGYRIGQDLDEDPRLKVFRKEWFEGKDCLDIGCNNGIITIQIAKKFLCRSILGIDIDSNRVQDAYWNLKKAVKLESSGKTPAKASKPRVEDHPDGNSEQMVTVSTNEEPKEFPRELTFVEKRHLFDAVSFRRENIVKSHHSPEKRYDTILCLSVTKWIQLNWGDDGLLALFAKTWKLLRPGGILVLEPQPWKSYESNRQVSETTAINYRNIMFRPEKFQEILLDKSLAFSSGRWRKARDFLFDEANTRLDSEPSKILLLNCQGARLVSIDQFWCSRNEPAIQKIFLFCFVLFCFGFG